MSKIKKNRIPIISIIMVCMLFLVGIGVQNLPKEQPAAASNEKIYLKEISSLNYKTKLHGTKKCFVFGRRLDNTYGVEPALYCLNLGQKANSGIPFLFISCFILKILIFIYFNLIRNKSSTIQDLQVFCID